MKKGSKVKKDDKTCSVTATCPVTGCPVRGVLLPAIAVFAVIFGFDWLWHGVFMMPYYEATASVWRAPEEMQSYCYINMIRQAVTAVLIVMLYRKSSCATGCPVRGAKFGAVIGLLLGITNFGAYAWLPIPMEIAVYWLIGNVVLGVLAGAVAALVCAKIDGKGAQ